MKTAYKVLVGLMLICALPGCCCCGGRGADNCLTTSWLGANPVPATAPNVFTTWPVAPATTTLAGTMTAPEVAMR